MPECDFCGASHVNPNAPGSCVRYWSNRAFKAEREKAVLVFKAEQENAVLRIHIAELTTELEILTKHQNKS